MITKYQALDYRDRAEQLRAWLGKRTSYKTEELPVHIKPLTHEETSALEIFEFTRDRPERYFGYVKLPEDWNASDANGRCRYGRLYGRTGAFTTWTGGKLGTIQFGRAWRDNFGGERVPISVHAITGDLYHGHYYASSGDFARIKRAATSTPRRAK